MGKLAYVIERKVKVEQNDRMEQGRRADHTENVVHCG